MVVKHSPLKQLRSEATSKRFNEAIKKKKDEEEVITKVGMKASFSPIKRIAHSAYRRPKEKYESVKANLAAQNKE